MIIMHKFFLIMKKYDEDLVVLYEHSKHELFLTYFSNKFIWIIFSYGTHSVFEQYGISIVYTYQKKVSVELINVSNLIFNLFH